MLHNFKHLPPLFRFLIGCAFFILMGLGIVALLVIR